MVVVRKLSVGVGRMPEAVVRTLAAVDLGAYTFADN